MPRKGMRSIFFLHATSPRGGGHTSPTTAAITSPDSHVFSDVIMEEKISIAEAVIAKWDPDRSPTAASSSLFRAENRAESGVFLHAVSDLQRAMQSFIAGSTVSGSALLIRAQNLMQLAIRRLEKEFHSILSSANRDFFDPEFVSSSRSSLSAASSFSTISDLDAAATPVAGVIRSETENSIADLRAIAECMISVGYAKECVKIYRITRRSIVEEGIFKLGFEKVPPSQIQKLDHDALEIKIRGWLAAAGTAFRGLFSVEKALCDRVFAASGSIRESCFVEVARDPAVEFLCFPELVVAWKPKRPPPVEKLLILELDLYSSILEIWPEMTSVFSDESTTAVQYQAATSLLKLGDAVRSSFAGFESAIQKENSKSPVPGGGIHPLTRHVMNHLSLLADHGGAIADVFAESLSTTWPPTPASSPSSGEGGESPFSPVSARFADLLSILLCKLDETADMYRQVALSFLFLANNYQFVVKKVRESNKLLQLLGDEWVAAQEEKAREYAASYERLGWRKTATAAASSPKSISGLSGSLKSGSAASDSPKSVLSESWRRLG